MRIQEQLIIFAPENVIPMEVNFEKEYLYELYTKGKASDKKHRYQPQIVRKYAQVVKLMTELENVNSLMK